jgi:hypothetical protein
MATNLLEKAGQVASSLIKGKMRLRDPKDLDSQVQRSDLAKPDSEPAIGDAEELIKLGEKRFEESRVGRWRHNARSLSGIAMFQDRQWDYWDEESGSYQPIPGVGNSNPDFDERMLRSQWNIIKVMAERVVARVTADYPDAWPAPETSSPEDKQAAQVMRAVLAHCSRITHLMELIEESLLVAYISTTCFIEVGWDAQAMAEVGFPRPDGAIEYRDAQIGDATAHLMLFTDAYPDPNAALANGDIHKGAYFIKRCTRTTEFIQRKWGKTVEATGVSSNYGFLEQRLEWIAGDQSRDMAKIDHCTDVTEVWEKPSKQFPDGRFWVYSADKTILYAGKWPYKKRDKYPFVPVRYQKNQASVWGMNGVESLRPIQLDLNHLATYIRTCLHWNRPERYIPMNAQIAPEDLNSPTFGRNIPFRPPSMGGDEPFWREPPPPGPWLFEYRKVLIEQAEYIAGVRDFNSDAAPAPSSGFEFELRVEQEKSRLGPVIRHMEGVVVEVMEWWGSFYEEFGTQFPRILGLDDKANPSNQDWSAAALVDLRALKNGRYRVVLQPGSGQSKSPAAREQRLDEMVKILAGTNMNPALAKFYLSLSQDIRSDAQVDQFIEESREYFAVQQQQALQVQQMRGDQAQQQNAQKAQQAQDQATVEQQQAEVEAAIKVHAEAQTQTWRMQADQAVEDKRAQNAVDLENLKFSHEMALAQQQSSQPKISVSVPIQPGVNTTRSIEEDAGWEPDDPAEIKAMNAPPPPAGAPPRPRPKASS